MTAPTDPRVEAVARAIHDAADNAFASFEFMRDMRLDQARAAIAVMDAPLPPDLAELEAAHAASSSGEWIAYGEQVWLMPVNGDPHSSEDQIAECYDLPPENTRFIALAHNHLPALLARLRTLEAVLENTLPAVQAFLDMVNVIQRFQALPIPTILETAQHNCSIILEQIQTALKGQEP